MDLHKIALVVFLDNKILGVFDNETSLNYFIDGGVQNNYFIKDKITVQTFGMNSCFNFNKVDVLKKQNIVKTNEINEDNAKIVILKQLEENKKRKELEKKKKELEESKEFQDMKQQQINVVHEINELKLKKKKLEEEKTSYDYDLTLYKNLNKEKEKNPEFKIPELFSLKYNLIMKLEESNKLDFDNFKLEWDVIKPKNNYNLFTTTSHEDSFVKKEQVTKPIEINLEL
jgi:hypothetical protein